MLNAIWQDDKHTKRGNTAAHTTQACTQTATCRIASRSASRSVPPRTAQENGMASGYSGAVSLADPLNSNNNAPHISGATGTREHS
ncbi:uncharacterized protein PHACADRAFT_265623 [Phanerochaete carnosa HHB-10118-sp]|uniref:Uncharacterized protein n=1 Tax=Phanerochaete carnosa (strain HHB-10118-sp) TaxID=650164 RepID=K5UJY8_PHACS|nr:uncharacterized protein PHACADRAFT_265623 [Phanerochaete carnosa HHB-10118-sp]EKM49876.1 hypothetical protein PHACADRAFT_265623 [Phanerochaete carnosa HHB-10118-sp]